MKKLLKLVLFFWIFLSLFNTPSIFAAGVLDHFEVILSEEAAQVWGSLDITIRAVDKVGEVITDYSGDILVFSESDSEAEFPNELSENSYSFTAADEGEVKFENAVSFKNQWTQDIYVYDLNDENILWVTEVEITAKEIEKNVDIQILSPENGVTIGSNSTTISGSSKKNHQIKITLNDTQEFTTTTNSEGVFEKEIENLQDGENTFIAEIFNSDDKVIGTSPSISLKVNSTAPEFKSIKVTPKGEIEAETEIQIEVYSNAGLSDVKVVVNDILTSLTEWQGGVYAGKTNAPNEAGKYGVDVILKDEFGHETKKSDVETLFVTEKIELNSAGDTETEVIVTEEIEEATPKNITELDLDITGIKLTELKTKSILTWDELKEAESYNIYKKIADNKVQLIENTASARFELEITGDEIRYDYFAIKAVGRTASGELIQWDLSEMTKVKTWPEMYILLSALALLLAASGMFLFRRRT